MTSYRPPLPDSYEGLLNRAQIAQRSGDTEGAIALYRRLVEKLGRLSDRILARRPDLGEMHLEAGLALTELLRSEGRFSEAYTVKSQLADKHPHLADDWRSDLATLRIAKGEVEAGLADLRALAEAGPEDPQGWVTLGSEARIEGRFSESQAALDRALEVGTEKDPAGAAEIHFQRFLLFKEMGRLDDAVAAWEKAAKRDPDMATTVRDVYTMLTDAGRYSEAQRYVARDGNPLQAGLHRGLIAQLTGDPVQARQEWQAVADLDPDDFQGGYDSWVEAVLRQGDPEPALERLQTVLATVQTPRLLILSGIAWAMRRDRELASMLFQQAINLLRQHRPPKQKLDSADWRLLDSLVTDDEIKTALKPYFAVVETVWG